MHIKIEKTEKDLSAHAGLIIFKQLLEKQRFEENWRGLVPSQKSGDERNIRKLKQLILGFQAGAECLDDLDRLSQDSAFKSMCDGRAYCAKSLGDLLRGFNDYRCKQLNKNLVGNGYQLRQQLFGNARSITIDIDSTKIQQYGKKMEGVARHYTGVLGYETVQAFDEYGFQYWNEVRPGNTHTSKGSVEIVHAVFSRMPETKQAKKMRRYVRADGGYCKTDFFNACAAKGAGFVVCMRGLMLSPLVGRIQYWQSQNPKKKNRIKFVGGRECEIGSTVYRPKRSEHVLRVVIVRSVKKGREGLLIKREEDYDYVGWVTNIGEHEMSDEKLIKFYRKRGHNAENMIRELKNGLDLKHYPCLSMVANKAFALMGSFAYNLMRFVALKDNPNKPQFAKAIRFRFVHLPCQVVKHARQVSFRLMGDQFEEVKRWINYIKTLQFAVW